MSRRLLAGGRRRAVLAALLVLLAGTIGAQQGPDKKKGFNANDVFQFNGLDNINAFNGNLIVTIPVGQAYPVGPSLSLRFGLVSNGNLWEPQDICRVVNGACATVCPFNKPCDDAERVRPTIMHPDRRANAGMGWQVTLGHLYHPGHPALQRSVWLYQSPDGSEHAFDHTEGVSQYTIDGSYLRMRLSPVTTIPGDTREERVVEFPNGEVHVFKKNTIGGWELAQIHDQHQNAIRISYERDQNGLETLWNLTDNHGRSHTVTFVQLLYDQAYRSMVSSIQLEAFQPVDAVVPRATYTFAYSSKSVNRGPNHTDDLHTPQTTNVQVLDGITLPDGSTYNFTHDSGSATDEKGGVLTSVVLPTGGKIAWEWARYENMPPGPPSLNPAFLGGATGVTTRTVSDRPDSTGSRRVIGTWSYSPMVSCEEGLRNGPNGECDAITFLENTITDPTGTKVENYFSLARFDTGDWKEVEYGQPMAKHLPDVTRTRCLSTRIIPAGATGPLRSTYTRMESTGGRYWRVASTRTEFNDDLIGGEPRYRDIDNTEWDGYGHFRQSTTSGTDTPPRTVRTEYLPPTETLWHTGLFTATSVQQEAERMTTDYCFASNGLLTSKRTLMSTSGTNRSPADVVIGYEYDTNGNVTGESYWGGDNGNAGTVQCAIPSGAFSYKLKHSWQAGALQQSTYQVQGDESVGYPSVDNEIDNATGLVRISRDTAGVMTTYRYDTMGRITNIVPEGRASTTYTYRNDATGVSVNAYQEDRNGRFLRGTGYQFDGIGRVVEESASMPEGDTRRDFEYDGLGRQTRQTEPYRVGEGLPQVTLFFYDALGRLLSRTMPDGSVFQTSFLGERVQTHTRKVETPLQPNQAVVTTEYYDGHGQLVRVDEPAGPTSAGLPNGANVSTLYSYDARGSLKTVFSSAGGDVQERRFDHDGRGFLRWESQPESGMASYQYDARGHVTAVEHGGAQSAFDLRYTYDRAENLVRVDGRNEFSGQPDEPAFHPLKAFAYGTSGTTRGKLLTATRYNFGPEYGSADRRYAHYRVVDAFEYDAAGRLAGKSTSIAIVDTLGAQLQPVKSDLRTYVTMDDLDLPLDTSYPFCLGCGVLGQLYHDGMTREYSAGYLVSMAPLVNSISYWPTGQRNVLQHANQINDTQVVERMGRPSSISFAKYDRCRAPIITSQPVSVRLGSTPVTMRVAAEGTEPLRYAWLSWRGVGDTVNEGTTSEIEVAPPVTTDYWVVVSNDCGTVQSRTATVGVNECPAPTTGQLRAIAQPSGQWVLTGDPTATAGAAYSWLCISGACPSPNLPVASESLTINAVSISTTYRLTITDSCGTATSTVTISVAPVQPFDGLLAQFVGPTEESNSFKVEITWPAVSGIGTFVVERRSGAEWQFLATTSGTIYTDTVPKGKAYAYRVAAGSRYSNADVVSDAVFIAANAGQTITTGPFGEMLRAVNLVRAAAGWPGLSWSTILSPSSPAPGGGRVVTREHLTACRNRMSEALQALGVRIVPYTDPDLTGQPVKAVHVNQIQERAR